MPHLEMSPKGFTETTTCAILGSRADPLLTYGWVTEAGVFVVDATQSGGHSLLPKVRSDSLSCSQSDGWVAGWL